MLISDVLRTKGSSVVTVAPDDSVRGLLAALISHNIGAVVVSGDGTSISGIVSERDIVRGLHRHGADVLTMAVSEIMTADVLTCSREDKADDLRPTMIQHRIRHLPVVEDGRIAGIVSIGDIVKSAISELENDREHLIGYIHG